jgi:hypothetical protein
MIAPSITWPPAQGTRSLGLALLILIGAHLEPLAVAQETNEWVSVTCELAHYADNSGAPGWRLIPPDADRTNLAAVQGVVLRIVEPKALAGRTFAFHFDGPPGFHNARFYEPGVLYQGEISRAYIGKLAFMCDPGFPATGLKRPLTPASAEDLRRLLQARHWDEQYVTAIRQQFGEKVLFRVLYGVLTDTNRSLTRYPDQQRAAGLLLRFQPACEVPLAAAMRDTLATWDEAVGDWPFYLRRCFSRGKILSVLAEWEKDKPGQTERDKIEIWRFWLSGPEDDPPRK